MGQVVIKSAFANGSIINEIAMTKIAVSKDQPKSCLGSVVILVGFLSNKQPVIIELHNMGKGQATP